MCMQLSNAKVKIPSVTAASMQHWAIFLLAYSYDIDIKMHANADSLSHLPM